MLRKDNIALGIVIGLVLPVLFYGVLRFAGLLIETGPAWARPFEQDRMMLLSIFINLIPIRLYFVSWKLDRTGRGVLLITFLLVMVFFLLNRFL